jgi:hypothetical protein
MGSETVVSIENVRRWRVEGVLQSVTSWESSGRNSPHPTRVRWVHVRCVVFSFGVETVAVGVQEAPVCDSFSTENVCRM